MAPALPRLGCWCIQVPRGSHPRKSCPASAVARSSRPAPSPATHCVTQAVLGRIAKVLGSMEGTSHPGNTQNCCRLASCRLSAVLEMAFKSPVEGRSQAGEQTDSSLNFSNGCRKSNLGSAPAIVHSELGVGLSQRKIQKLISKSRITDLRNGGQHSYVSARRLFWVIRELQAVANGESTRARHQS
jgi:hypothetical protein